MDNNTTPVIPEVAEQNPMELIEVEVSEDKMKVYVKFLKPKNRDQVFKPTKEQVMEAMEAAGIVYGLKESSIEKLVTRPIYNIKIQVGEGTPAVQGVDGFVEFFVKKDKDYSPEIDEEGNVDFKNLDYFQMVKEGQMLAAVHPQEAGQPGKNVLGMDLPAKDGREAKNPMGKNTTYNEEQNILFAACDGIVNFVTDTINISDVLHIAGNVDNNTGNIDFSGDVIIEGDVREGYNVRAGGNLIIKGVVESCNIEAGGDVQIVKGINGDNGCSINVGGDFRSLYIEHCTVDVGGNIMAESIIESNITCEGDIDVASSGRGALVGGDVNLKGQLIVKTLGNENERITNVRILGVETGVQDEITSLMVEKESCAKGIEKLKIERRKLFQPMLEENDPINIKIKKIDSDVLLLQSKLEEIGRKIQEMKSKWSYEYLGAVACKGKMYFGTRIYFGDERYQFTTESLDHCKIYWEDGEIINAVL